MCGPVNPCCSAVSVPLPLRVNIGLTTCNDILSYACLTPKEPHPLSCVCVCVCGCHSVSPPCISYCLFSITQHPHLLFLCFFLLEHFHFPPSSSLSFLLFLSPAPPHPLSPPLYPYLPPSLSLSLSFSFPSLTPFYSLCGPEGLPTSLLSSLPV